MMHLTSPFTPAKEVRSQVKVSIVIPTFRREHLLPRLLKLCAAQGGLGPEALEIIIVDNTPEATAQPVVEPIVATSPVRIHYIHEPRPGISHARNRGVAEAKGDLIAFIDDDELPAPEWLEKLLLTQRTYCADVVLGPTCAVFDDVPEHMVDVFQHLFTHSSDTPTGTPVSPHRALRLGSHQACYRPMASGNALLVKAHCFEGEEPFNPELGLIGGEDTLFFTKLHRAGLRIIWCKEAIITEQITHERLTIKYLLQRKFRNGQTTSSTCLMLDPPQYGQLATWVVVGFIQLAVGGSVVALTYAFNRRLGVRGLCMAATGLGKLLFFDKIRRRNYGVRAEL